MGRAIKHDNIWDYWVNKLLFPKIYIIDKPGVIISTASKLLGSHTTKKREVYHFEKIFAQLQEKTSEKLGIQKASKFYYEIGKDLGVGYLLLSNTKHIPLFLVPSIMEMICKITWASGISASGKVSIYKNGKYILTGSDNLFCRESKNSSFYAGLYSGMLSHLSGKNIEAKTDCKNCPNGCKIILDPAFSKKYIPDTNNLKLNKDRAKINIPEIIPKSSRPSFSDLIKFNKISFDNSKICLNRETIFSTEQEMFDLITRYYIKNNLKDFFKETVIESSEKLSKRLFNNKSSKNNFEEMLNILCAFGWGIPEYSNVKSELIIKFYCAPISSNPPLYRGLIINGFLNAILGKKYKIKEILSDSKSRTIKMIYNKI
jgi:hypothetical protein